MHHIKFTTEELFEIVEMLGDKLQYRQDLIPLYKISPLESYFGASSGLAPCFDL